MDAYSQIKPLLWHDRIEALREARQPVPVHVQLILSDLCNQDCHFCAYRMSAGLSTELFKTAATHNPNRKISTEKAKEIIADCAEIGVKAIQFTGGGEPTVHPDHDELFAFAQGLGLKTAVVTNGIKLLPTMATLNMEWIRVSVDAGTAETYARIRRVSVSHWNKVWKSIANLADFDGRLGVGFVVTPDNYHELPALARLCREYGVDNLRVGAVFSGAGIHYYNGLFDEIATYIQATKEDLDDKDFEIIDLFGRRVSDLEGGSPTQPFCGYQYFTAYIGADLNVYRCCNTAYTKKGRVGSLNGFRFKDALPFFSYAPFDARTCQFCQFHGQNQAINAMLNPPEHSEFV